MFHHEDMGNSPMGLIVERFFDNAGLIIFHNRTHAHTLLIPAAYT